MNQFKKIPVSLILTCVVLFILLGTYMLFPQGEKSEYFYLILMTIVISGAGDQIVRLIFKKISSRNVPKNLKVDDEEQNDK